MPTAIPMVFPFELLDLFQDGQLLWETLCCREKLTQRQRCWQERLYQRLNGLTMSDHVQ